MNWSQIIAREQNKPYYQEIQKFLDEAYLQSTVYPSEENIFRAFDLCEYADVKVVIIGQDPYHGENQANGLSFSVFENEPLPPSLRNIYKELQSDLNISRTDGVLDGWATQGVLMLNMILTVEAKNPASHQHIGWQQFTESIIHSLNEHDRSIIYVLWGNYAKGLKKHISDKHIIIESAHPSPLAAYRGFFGSKPFSKINEILINNNEQEIDWSM